MFFCLPLFLLLRWFFRLSFCLLCKYKDFIFIMQIYNKVFIQILYIIFMFDV